MKPKMFEELLESVREGGAIVRGQKKASRRFEVGSSGIRAIRERTSLSQSAFASLIGVSVKTLQNWEQDRRRPDKNRGRARDADGGTEHSAGDPDDGGPSPCIRGGIFGRHGKIDQPRRGIAIHVFVEEIGLIEPHEDTRQVVSPKQERNRKNEGQQRPLPAGHVSHLSMDSGDACRVLSSARWLPTSVRRRTATDDLTLAIYLHYGRF